MRLECQVAASRWPWEKDAYEFLESLWLGGYLRSKAIVRIFIHHSLFPHSKEKT